jgi:sugar lactone lactonase YvrE
VKWRMVQIAALVLVVALVLAMGVGALLSAASGSERQRWDTEVFARVPSPGFPASAYVHPSRRVYAGTYTDPAGDSRRSRVFEWTASGTLLRSWTVPGQNLSEEHGVQVATSDAQGRLVLLDRSPARVLLLDTRTGGFTTYARFPDGSVPNFAAWGPGGALYVSDYAQPTLWRVPAGGGKPRAWLTDQRLDGGPFGTTGLRLAADRHTLLVAQQSSAGSGSSGGEPNPATGKLYAVPIRAGARPGEMSMLWESRPADSPDGFAIARSGRIYIANVSPTSNQVVVLAMDGREIERFPETPVTGDNGSAVPFDSPSSAAFLGTRIIVANQAYVTGDRDHHALLDVESGERGLPILIPRNAG